ncbi:MAG: hypothetical protein EBY32_00675 [Proteobacteria bacterium]|nr:hypothetical protein [Pseudomonadota bacterium]
MKITPILTAALVFLLGACTHSSGARPPAPRISWLSSLGKFLPKKKPRPPAATPVNWAGTIRMVNTAENFVLIESDSATPVVAGEKYLSVQNGRESGALLMTSLKAHPFLIADIVAGNPSTGDKIYIPRLAWSESTVGSAASSTDMPPAESAPQN